MSLKNRWSSWRFSRALHYLECEEFDKTEKIGHQLVQGHYTGGFEILGRLALGIGDYAEAISWLKRGPDEAPEIPNFWSYLGQCYSDTGEYDLAEHAFWRYCDLQPDEPAGYLNLAVVYGRKGEPAAGLEALTAAVAGDDTWRRRIGSTRTWLLYDSSRADEAEAMAVKLQSEGLSTASTIAIHGRILFERGERESAGRLALKAIERDKTCLEARQLIRELHGCTSADSKVFHCLVNGVVALPFPQWKNLFSKKPHRFSFVASFHVQAPTCTKALEFIRPFEASSLEPLTMDECKATEEALSGCDGVLWVARGYDCYRE